MIVDQGHLPSYAALNSIESLASIASSEPSKLEKDVSCPWTGPMEKLKTSAASLICALEGPTANLHELDLGSLATSLSTFRSTTKKLSPCDNSSKVQAPLIGEEGHSEVNGLIAKAASVLNDIHGVIRKEVSSSPADFVNLVSELNKVAIEIETVFRVSAALAQLAKGRKGQLVLNATNSRIQVEGPIGVDNEGDIFINCEGATIIAGGGFGCGNRAGSSSRGDTSSQYFNGNMNISRVDNRSASMMDSRLPRDFERMSLGLGPSKDLQLSRKSQSTIIWSNDCEPWETYDYRKF